MSFEKQKQPLHVEDEQAKRDRKLAIGRTKEQEKKGQEDKSALHVRLEFSRNGINKDSVDSCGVFEWAVRWG